MLSDPEALERFANESGLAGIRYEHDNAKSFEEKYVLWQRSAYTLIEPYQLGTDADAEQVLVMTQSVDKVTDHGAQVSQRLGNMNRSVFEYEVTRETAWVSVSYEDMLAECQKLSQDLQTIKTERGGGVADTELIDKFVSFTNSAQTRDWAFHRLQAKSKCDRVSSQFESRHGSRPSKAWTDLQYVKALNDVGNESRLLIRNIALKAKAGHELVMARRGQKKQTEEGNDGVEGTVEGSHTPVRTDKDTDTGTARSAATVPTTAQAVMDHE